jgi:lipopolysaccharide transport system ATP-binding protein
MSNIAIKVEGLGKKYIIGHQGKGSYKTFREQIGDNLKTIFSKTKKMLSGQMLVEGDEMEEFWALKDISFEVKQGEVLGIIGRNGAGKSTLLKILSRITEPTTGKVILKGRVASLLEVGTGFHPELSGRENIFLNGAILGMSRVEIKRKFDEIVDFSGVEKFLDTPVKRYSSGMYVRLAFSVAAHLEPQILIVDEVLAVGDTEFQKKCMGRMQDVSKNDGRTVLFVSHNMGAISQLCNEAIVLNKGQMGFIGSTENAIDFYSNTNERVIFLDKPILNEEHFQFLKAYNSDGDDNIKSEFTYNESIQIYTEIYIPKEPDYEELCISVYDKNKRRVFSILEPLKKYYNNENKIKLMTTFPPKFLTPGHYSSLMCIVHPGIKVDDLQDDILPFTIIETGSDFARYDGLDYGCVHANYSIKQY